MTLTHETTIPIESEPSQINKKLSFLLVDHSQENVDDIYRQIADSDAEVVLLELVGSPTVLREDVEARINRGILAKTLDDRVRETNGLSQSFKDLVWTLSGSSKQFGFIDIASDSPEYELVLKAREAKKKKSPLYDQYFAESVKARDDVLASQLVTANNNYVGKKILAVMGAIHKGVAERFDDSDIAFSDTHVMERARARMALLALDYRE